MRLKSDNDEIILDAFINNSSQNEIVSSYNIKYSKSWKNIKVNNTYILYDETELHIYTFNTEFKKIKLQYCYNIKFLKYAIKLYNKIKLDALEIEEIKEIAHPTDNDGLKKQWILYVINQKYFFAYYGENLLKSAIKQHNIEIIELIYNKTLEYFKKNPNNNILILSLLCKNMPYLNQNYSEFLSKYYNEMNLFADSSNSSMIYNNLQHHLYPYCNELKISKNIFICYFLHKLYVLAFLYPLYIIQNLFLKLSKFLKLQSYQLVLLLVGSVLLYDIISIIGKIIVGGRIGIKEVLDIITIIILSVRKYWKSRSSSL
ncbi:unnamed protein product [Rhizophagus irregularis]|nr:unnamed protein product [Rhizophagus irregularis]CAB5394569.1 unnamed protein product [Rhizophagus irregularis]